MSNLMWHFATVDNDGTPRLGYGDGRAIVVGETLRVEGEPVLCSTGLHASTRLWDALSYARDGTLTLCRVTLGGTVKHRDKKSVASERTVIAMLSAEQTDKLLSDFAKWCALQVIHLWDAPDVVRQYLETGDESLRAATGAATGVAAWAAAGEAAWEAAWAAARAAAWDVAWAAARAAAWDVAQDVAWDVAWDVARAAAMDEKLEEYAAELERRALEAIGETP